MKGVWAMGPQKRNGLTICGGQRLLILLGLQLVVLLFLFGPLLATEEFYVWWDRSIVFPGDQPESHGKPASKYQRFPVGGAPPPVKESKSVDLELLRKRGISLPPQNELSKNLMEQNLQPPRNQDLYPVLAQDHVKVVLYVHNRPEYLRLVVGGLSEVHGIEETLLIVSHDGFFEEMNSIIEGIRFCQVKQLYAPWSPHLFPNSFPGVTPGDCKEKEKAEELGCRGNPDQYGNHRGVRIVSLKHHWWWMMNTVWDGLAETKGFDGYIMFIEEDHYLLPNAYRNIQTLTRSKGEKCPYCIAANIAPENIHSRGEHVTVLVAEKVGNMGYTFNHSVWKRIHSQARSFCTYDDYNWDITMWATIYPTFGSALFTLRGPRTSAIHIGKCGLHQGYRKGLDKPACEDNGLRPPAVDDQDRVPNINPNWKLYKYNIKGYAFGFQGWGGWGDQRDQQLCLNFSSMYGDW